MSNKKVTFSDHETYNFEFTNLSLNIVPKKGVKY